MSQVRCVLIWRGFGSAGSLGLSVILRRRLIALSVSGCLVAGGGEKKAVDYLLSDASLVGNALTSLEVDRAATPEISSLNDRQQGREHDLERDRMLTEITERMEAAMCSVGVTVEELIEETLAVRAEIAREEFGEQVLLA